jgi:hypothetical protein
MPRPKASDHIPVSQSLFSARASQHIVVHCLHHESIVLEIEPMCKNFVEIYLCYGQAMRAGVDKQDEPIRHHDPMSIIIGQPAHAVLRYQQQRYLLSE